MKSIITFAGSFALLGTTALAGGLDRSGNDYSILFEDGNYAKFSLSSVQPDITGTYPAALGGGTTNNMQKDYTTFGGALKYGISEGLDIGLYFNEPFGANSSYTQGAYTGLDGKWSSQQIAMTLSYEAMPDVTVFGGVRSVESSADIALPGAIVRGGLIKGVGAKLAEARTAGNTVAVTALTTQLATLNNLSNAAFNYSAKTDKHRATGFVLGGAYERPDIALRVGLTYESKLTHKFQVAEVIPARKDLTGTTALEVEMPQSVTLDFQSGVAADTLVFGSIKWADWDQWEIRPDGYSGLTNGNRVTGIDSDTITYRIGVGRKFNESFSGFARVTYEPSNDDELNRLAPTNGSTAFGIGGSYTIDNAKITAGLEYVKLGGGKDGSGVEFDGNKAIGAGLSVGFSF